MTYAERRRKLKAGILGDLADTVVAEAWGTWVGHAEDLDLTDHTLYTVMEEVGRELSGRAQRLEHP